MNKIPVNELIDKLSSGTRRKITRLHKDAKGATRTLDDDIAMGKLLWRDLSKRDGAMRAFESVCYNYNSGEYLPQSVFKGQYANSLFERVTYPFMTMEEKKEGGICAAEESKCMIEHLAFTKLLKDRVPPYLVTREFCDAIQRSDINEDWDLNS